MSQQVFSDIDPEVTTGLMLSALLNDFKDALLSGLSGTSRPVQLLAGGIWVDTSLQGAPDYKWIMKMYNGSADKEILSIDVLTGSSGFNRADDLFTVRKISEDTAGAILNLVKNRIDAGGQVKQDDLIARIRFLGHTETDQDVITAYMQATAEEDLESTSRGVVLSFYSTPAGTNSAIEHLKLIAGTIESVKPHKFNSIIFGQDTVAGSANMLVTDDKMVTEITGAVGELIHGVENDSLGTKIKVIINAGTVDLKLKHESTVVSVGQRLKLPFTDDITIPPNGSVTLYYCSTDSRWKYISGAITGLRKDMIEFFGGYSEWVSPITGNVRIIGYLNVPDKSDGASQKNSYAHSDLSGLFSWGRNHNGQLGVGDTNPRSVPTLYLGPSRLRDARVGEDSSWGRTERSIAYAWGLNTHGQLGLGDVIPRSSPVAVLGDLRFTRLEVRESSYGFVQGNSIYAWGRNDAGQLGVGDVLPRSSPVAVLGGLKFSEFYTGASGEKRAFGVQESTGFLFAWGANPSGELGIGDAAARSSPVAVLGGLKFTKVALGTSSTVGITSDGTLYAWGLNDAGQLGVGDVTPRSSPVAVLGGLTIVDIKAISGKSFLAIKKDGTAYAWGENTYGQLGDGTSASKSSPVAVAGGLKFESFPRLSWGGFVVGIERASGIAYSWGLNDVGQLGDNSIVNKSSPVLVLGSKLFAEIRCGSSSSYGFATDGYVYAWGLNDVGQLGDNSVVNKSSPVLVSNSPFLKPTRIVKTLNYLPVVKGTTYVVKCAGGVATFGGKVIGTNIGKVTVAYDN